MSEDGVLIVLIHKQRCAAYRGWVWCVGVGEAGAVVELERRVLCDGRSNARNFRCLGRSEFWVFAEAQVGVEPVEDSSTVQLRTGSGQLSGLQRCREAVTSGRCCEVALESPKTMVAECVWVVREVF